MKIWEKFEIDITKFLNSQFPNLDFTNEGQSDSTKSDILVKNNSSNLFYIESKLDKSQSGQIVIMEKNNSFILSPRSKNIKNDVNDAILSIINNEKDKYTDIKQNSTPIEIEKNILYDWIINHYHSKNAQWIITSKDRHGFNKNNVCLFPTKYIKNYFDVNIVMRRKKSGSSDIPKKDYNKFISKLRTYDINCKTEIVKNKLYVTTTESKGLSFEIDNNKYFLSDQGIDLKSNQFRVKKLSSTNNINIMFKISLKNNIDFREKEFIEYVTTYTA